MDVEFLCELQECRNEARVRNLDDFRVWWPRSRIWGKQLIQFIYDHFWRDGSGDHFKDFYAWLREEE